ncbi:MAG: efflux RND transporter periplasmic adaptor subunit [Phycisphaera sp.]|nr:MAG: efflux RND transporter periplasmic adaptor subunit [Phycisphaera sp.]
MIQLKQSVTAKLLLAMGVACVLASCEEPTSFEPPPPPTVTVATPLVQEVTTFQEFTGQLAADKSIDVRARVQGFLRTVEFEDGFVVTGPTESEEGQVLFTIEPEPFEARLSAAKAELAQAVASRDLASVRRDRTKQALEQAAASEIEVIEREAEVAVAEAAVLAAQAQVDTAEIELEYTTIRAPISGRASRSMVDPGNLVGGGEPTLLTTIVQDDPIYAYIEISERDLLEFVEDAGHRPERPSDEEAKPVTLVTADGEEYSHRGRFDFAETGLDATTGTLTARAAFPNADGSLFPGMFVRLLVPDITGEQTLVPEVAVQRDLAGSYVLVVNASNTVERRSIETAQVVDGNRIVLSGLAHTDRVIVNGVQRAFPGATVTPQTASSAPASPPQPPASDSDDEEGTP